MKKRQLGNSGIAVHPIGVGLWAMGGTQWGPTEDRESLQVIDRALELGIDFYDTADVYGDGHSEELLGIAMKGRRDRFVLGTKIGWVGYDGDAVTSAYTSPQKVVEGIEANLRRLQTDYVDLLQWHVHFEDATMEHFIAGSQKLKEQGKIRAFGVSTSDIGFVREFFDASGADTLQIDYSILNRTPEEEIFPFCREHTIGTIIRGGLAMGILTGKISLESSFDADDYRCAWKTDPDQNQQFRADLETVNTLREAFPESNLAQLALRFIISNPAVSATIPGAKRISQLESNFAAAEAGPLTAEEQRIIDEIVAPAGGRKIWPA